MLVVNGTPLSDHGFQGSARRVARLGGERSRIQVPPGATLAHRLGGAYEPGSVSVTGWVKGTSHDDLLQKLDAITALVNTGDDLVLRLSDVADREWLGRLQAGSTADELGAQQTTAHAQLSLEFALLGPARAQSDTIHASSSALDLGTAPSPLRVSITNGASAPITRAIVQVRAGGAAGSIEQELDWNGSVALGEALVIDAETFAVTNNGVNAIGGLTSDSEFPIPDPRAGHDYVTVSLTGGSGAVREIRYRPRWF